LGIHRIPVRDGSLEGVDAAALAPELGAGGDVDVHEHKTKPALASAATSPWRSTGTLRLM